ncbi:ral guanine nucleotide dissociation stimulator-like [Dasypus novemcinctus]|uniref:ral guanine nucleotide dissociation stimulator-like n=1 Tax=Dasypus novemcinctus TaxID=9361 RepID=UPI0039C92FC7
MTCPQPTPSSLLSKAMRLAVRRRHGRKFPGTASTSFRHCLRFSPLRATPPGSELISQGTMVNFEKRRKEYQLVAELQQLQVRCCDDCLVPDGHFGTWFEAVEQLGQDSLLLSREWELPPESASESFQAQQPPEGSKALERRPPGPRH